MSVMDLGSVGYRGTRAVLEPGAIKLQSSKMAQNCSIPLAILQDSVSGVEERSSPHASARSATDEWLKVLEG